MPSRKRSKGKPQPDDTASQLPLDLGDLSELLLPTAPLKKNQDSALTSLGRIERVTSRDEFEAAITALGGDRLAIRSATGALYRAAFNMTASELYQHYGVAAERDFLPAVVQRLIQVHELVNAERLRNHTLPDGLTEQHAINDHIVVIVRRQTEHTEIFLATFKLFGKGAQLGPKKASLKPKPPISIDTEYGPIECEVLEVENDDDIPF